MSGLRVGIAGATGALGKEIVAVLDGSPWRPDEIVPLASARTTVPFVEYGGEQVAVDDLADQSFGDLDALIVALPAEIAKGVAAKAADEGVATVDASGSLREDPDVPLVLPWLDPERLAELAEHRAAVLPSAPAALLASVLGPLRRAGIDGEVAATVLLPASHFGRDGIDELSKQVVALFNAGTPPRKVFEHGLAFDLLPQVGALGATGWTDLEVRVAVELQRLLDGQRARVHLVGAPVFSGVSATISVRAERQVPADLLTQILEDGGIRLPKEPIPRYLPRPRRVEGRAGVQVGRVRVDEDGVLHLFAAMDNLRAMATAAVAACGAMVRAAE